MSALKNFFEPKSVAVIGASRTPGKIGYHILENLKDTFKGQIYPINPNATELQGLTSYMSVLNIEQPIDLAVIAVKEEAVKNVMEECKKKKIKSVIIITAGYSEIGNKEAEKELQSFSKDKKIRILGPNCLGILSKDINTLFFPKNRIKFPQHGFLSIITQSGAVGSVLLDSLADNGSGISKFLSIGNKVDIEELEILDFLEKDLQTRAIAMYIEHLDNGKNFIKQAQKVSKTKPIVILKAGKTDKGNEAVISHTGKMASSHDVYSAAFKQAGVIEVGDMEELLDISRILATQPTLKGNKIAIITDGGGFGVLAADEAIKLGFDVVEFSKDTKKALKSALPDYASTSNPVDLIGDSNAERYEKTLNAVLKDKEVSAVVCIVLFQIPTLEESVVETIRDAKIHGKPLIVVSSGSEYSRAQSYKLESAGIPVFPTPKRGVAALKALLDWSKSQKVAKK